ENEWRIGSYPHQLSGGQRHRVMIAMALVNEPDLLIAEEPTTALDVTIQAQILELLGSLQAELGMAILLITHDLGVVANLADEVVVVYQGRLMERGSVADVFTRPGHAYLQALMRAVPRVGLARGERLTPIREVQRSGGGYLSGGTDAGPRAESTVEVAPAARPGGLVTATPAILELEGICKTFTGRRAAGSMEPSPPALSDVSLSIRTGECLGLVGESGCGKTTLSKVILRVVRPDSGRITYLDAPAANGHAGARARDVLALGAAELFEYRRQVQYIFQDPFGSLNPRMTVFDIIAEPLLIHGIGRPEERREIVTELLGQVGMNSTHLPRYPHSFSGGQRQRIGIARALALRPRLLICDEPVSALDVSVQAQVLNLLQELKQELGLTYLFVSHNLAVVDYMADRIAVMCQGCIVEMNTRERLFATPLHPYTKALLAAVPQVSLEHRLDLGALMAGKVSDPRSWPAPFGPGGDGELPGLIEVEAGHLVRAEGSLQGSPTRRGE
ncbi:MAG: ABC transporter ATP-binding protein, partial [Gammaproteobacteria bacterium]|nr:ABC transporter ATP-binding protein [Gammaproteobacteria bacterium]